MTKLNIKEYISVSTWLNSFLNNCWYFPTMERFYRVHRVLHRPCLLNLSFTIFPYYLLYSFFISLHISVSACFFSFYIFYQSARLPSQELVFVTLTLLVIRKYYCLQIPENLSKENPQKAKFRENCITWGWERLVDYLFPNKLSFLLSVNFSIGYDPAHKTRYDEIR